MSTKEIIALRQRLNSNKRKIKKLNQNNSEIESKIYNMEKEYENNKEKWKKQIIDAAVNVFLKSGYKKASLDEIAKAANVTMHEVTSIFAKEENIKKGIWLECHSYLILFNLSSDLAYAYSVTKYLNKMNEIIGFVKKRLRMLFKTYKEVNEEGYCSNTYNFFDYHARLEELISMELLKNGKSKRHAKTICHETIRSFYKILDCSNEEYDRKSSEIIENVLKIIA